MWCRCEPRGWPREDEFRELARQLGGIEELGDRTPAGPGLLFLSGPGAVPADVLQAIQSAGAPAIAVLAGSLAGAAHELVWRLLQAGVRDVLHWDGCEPIGAAIAGRFARWAAAASVLDSPLVRDNLAGTSQAWRSVLRETADLALHSTASILITGETGTGKEILARLVHTLDPRTDKGRLVTLDCTTVVPDLSGSEFFGHERGAYTGAQSARDGAFALAHRGTLFLDEVGELPLGLQTQLLRVIQEKTYKPLGGNDWRQTDFRLICATNRDLGQELQEGRFRADFYHRLAVCRIHVPPLRERREDILPLARHFLAQEIDPPPGFDETVERFLLTRDYPGNVRDLRQLVRRMSARHAGPGLVTPGDIPPADRPAQFPAWRADALEAAVRSAVLGGASLKDIGRTAGEIAERIALEQENGNVQRAASRLGVTGRALQLRRAARRGNDPGAPASSPP